MKKTIIIIAIIILVGVGLYSFFGREKFDERDCSLSEGEAWCDYTQSCSQECEITSDWVLNKAKKEIGMDLNTMVEQFIEWNLGNEEVAFEAKGIYYTDLQESVKITQGFQDWDVLLKEIGLEGDSNNPEVNTDQEKIHKYVKGDLVCELKQVNNSNKTSSLGLYCGNQNDKLCNFGTDCGKTCETDENCSLAVDGCARKVVCRNLDSKFYQDCKDPTAKVSDIDSRIGECICLENQCVPKNEKHR